ncbi:MAG TPA: sigma-54 dependent transcriptional regulator [bacterium]|nr:sigma-54 dependent transcriptional regulator [bacterium]
MTGNGRPADTERFPQGLILVVEDDPAGIRLYRKILANYPEAVFFGDGSEAARFIETAGLISLAFVDFILPGESGLELVAELNRRFPQAEVFMITGLDDIQTAVKAVKAGAANYLLKPFRVSEMRTIVERNRRREQMRLENLDLQRLLEAKDREPVLVGRSHGIRKVREMALSVAPLDATVLILGETGTGKDLLARFIHAHSERARSGFVIADLSALNERLIESDLFGHEKGAFTGAHERRVGKFERASGGTIFLNEIGNLSLGAQQKLLRVLEDRKMERVGGDVTISVDIRIVAATSTDLEGDTARGTFRPDLLYRLNVFTITIPPLRERREDIPLLIDYFLKLHCARYGRPRLAPPPAAIERLLDYPWPGNVRELKHALERAVIAGDFNRLFLDAGSGPHRKTSAGKSLAEIERERIESVLQLTSGNLARAARELGISRSTLYGKLKKYGIEARRPRGQ